MSKAYVPAPSDVLPTPSAAQVAAGFPHWNSNPQGSPYAATYGRDTTIHLQKDIYPHIYKAIPEQFSALKLLMAKQVDYVNGDVFEYTERGIARPSLVVATANSNQPVLQAGQGKLVSIGDEIVLEDNTHGIITNISGDTITITAQQGGATVVPTAGETLIVQAPLTTDGVNFTNHFDKLVTITRDNYVGFGERGRRWTRLEKTKYENAGNTDYYTQDKLEKMELIYQDMFSTFWNGKKGEYFLPAVAGDNGRHYAKTPNGIYPLMVSGGSQHATSSPTTIVADFEKLAFNSNYKATGAPRFIFGTDKMLYELSKAFKNPVRYRPDDSRADLNLMQYELGTMKFVPVPVALFERRSNLFPPFFENMLFVLDTETITPVCIKGYQPIELYSTKQDKANGGRETYNDFTAQFCVSLKMNNLDGSFYITGIGF